MLDSVTSDPKKTRIVTIIAIIVIVVVLAVMGPRLFGKHRVNTGSPPAPSASEAATSAAAAATSAPTAGTAVAQAPATPPPPPPGEGAAPAAPEMAVPGPAGTPSPLGLAEAAPAPPADEDAPVDLGEPKEWFRSNPFRPKPTTVAVAALPMDDRANIFAERMFPQARQIRQPLSPAAEPLGVRPAYWTVPAADIVVTNEPIRPGLAVSPAVVAPRPPVTTPEAATAEETREVRKPATYAIRRVAGLLHDGIAIAIIEAVEGDTVRSLVVKPGESIVLGGTRLVVRRIDRESVTLRESGSTQDIVIRLRGRAANEE